LINKLFGKGKEPRSVIIMHAQALDNESRDSIMVGIGKRGSVIPKDLTNRGIAAPIMAVGHTTREDWGYRRKGAFRFSILSKEFDNSGRYAPVAIYAENMSKKDIKQHTMNF
jgi:hypothetical protein